MSCDKRNKSNYDIGMHQTVEVYKDISDFHHYSDFGIFNAHDCGGFIHFGEAQ